jgi:hypothetical protein
MPTTWPQVFSAAQYQNVAFRNSKASSDNFMEKELLRAKEPDERSVDKDSHSPGAGVKLPAAPKHESALRPWWKTMLAQALSLLWLAPIMTLLVLNIKGHSIGPSACESTSQILWSSA